MEQEVIEPKPVGVESLVATRRRWADTCEDTEDAGAAEAAELWRNGGYGHSFFGGQRSDHVVPSIREESATRDDVQDGLQMFHK